MPEYLTLAILPGLTIKSLPNNQVVITRKFIEAVALLQSMWPGAVKVLIEESRYQIEDVDKRVVDLDDLPFEMELVNYDDENFAEKLRNCIVLASVGYRQNHISELCLKVGSPCVYAAEYTLKTRHQIINVSTNNVLLAIRRRLWEEKQERLQRRAISLADGVQCNGVPIYEEYQSISSNPLLFLDTRITEEMLATPADIEQRTADRAPDAPLRLAFSGRLNKMKGVNHLLDVAVQLDRLGVKYELYISGSGALEASMKQRIEAEKLGDRVIMMGVPDFKSEFFPFVKQNIDLFVCCHRQGDPSCTYIETMSCGVPIVGYANEAFAGLSRYSKTGWLVEMDQPQRMAQKIAELSRDRAQIKTMSFASLAYARRHTFIETFQARVNHLKQIIAQPTRQEVVEAKPRRISYANFTRRGVLVTK
jgi:glycosyltransferase involved in cell wall biosynthesis